MADSTPVRFSRYVALGDSSTEGIDEPRRNRRLPRLVAAALAEHIAAQQGGLLYANFAVRGLTTAQVRARQLDAALALQPDLATVFCGTNDVTAPRFDADHVAADIAHMQRALVAGGATVLSFTLPDLTPLMPLARLDRARIAALNGALTQRRLAPVRSSSTSPPVPSPPMPRLSSGDRHATPTPPATPASPPRLPTLCACRAATLRERALPHRTRSFRSPALAPPKHVGCGVHLLPWILQGLAGRSSADGRGPKRPQARSPSVCQPALLLPHCQRPLATRVDAVAIRKVSLVHRHRDEAHAVDERRFFPTGTSPNVRA